MQLNSNGQHRDIAKAIRHFQHDQWQALSIASRLVWMREMQRGGHLDSSSWSRYCRLDIEHFTVQIRSAMDYLAIVIAGCSEKNGQIPKTFAKLRNYANKESNRLDPEIRDLLHGATWFDELRMIRDSLVHGGSESIVFPDDDEWLLFQIYGNGLRNMVSAPFMLHNENVAYFQKFAAWSFAHTLSIADRVGTLISPKFEHKTGVGPGKSYEFTLLHRWTTNLLNQLRGST